MFNNSLKISDARYIGLKDEKANEIPQSYSKHCIIPQLMQSKQIFV